MIETQSTRVGDYVVKTFNDEEFYFLRVYHQPTTASLGVEMTSARMTAYSETIARKNHEDAVGRWRS